MGKEKQSKADRARKRSQKHTADNPTLDVQFVSGSALKAAGDAINMVVEVSKALESSRENNKKKVLADHKAALEKVERAKTELEKVRHDNSGWLGSDQAIKHAEEVLRHSEAVVKLLNAQKFAVLYPPKYRGGSVDDFKLGTSSGTVMERVEGKQHAQDDIGTHMTSTDKDQAIKQTSKLQKALEGLKKAFKAFCKAVGAPFKALADLIDSAIEKVNELGDQLRKTKVGQSLDEFGKGGLAKRTELSLKADAKFVKDLVKGDGGGRGK